MMRNTPLTTLTIFILGLVVLLVVAWDGDNNPDQTVSTKVPGVFIIDADITQLEQFQLELQDQLNAARR